MATDTTRDDEQTTGATPGAGRGRAVPFGLAGNTKGRELLEDFLDKVDSSEVLSRLGQSLAELTGKVIKPGKFKDLLSGTWLGHPLHPMLTDLPIGFWTSSFMLDIVGKEKGQGASDALLGMGVLAALPTAVSGLSDLSDVGEDEGLRIGTAHALGNGAALACYALSYAARKTGNRREGIFLSTAGAALATLGGYFGGHMTYRRAIGVNRTAFDKPVGEWTAVMAADDLVEGEPKMARLEGDDIFLLRAPDTIYAIANRCSHRGGPLNEGEIRDGTVTCPWHMSTFNLKDGSVVNGPATAPQPCYEARIKKGKVQLRSRT